MLLLLLAEHVDSPFKIRCGRLRDRLRLGERLGWLLLLLLRCILDDLEQVGDVELIVGCILLCSGCWLRIDERIVPFLPSLQEVSLVIVQEYRALEKKDLP